jgi:ribA/ribD-fused uncharacterized protein
MADFIFKDNLWKVSHSPTHVYFVGGPFSQWFMRPFTAPMPCIETSEDSDGDRYTFNCAEQYMMSAKAALFSDYDALAEILAAKLPKEQKLIGRRVNRFDPDVWNEKAKSVVTMGNIAKFNQHSDLREYLFATGDKKIVEGAWYDPVWGVKLAWDDPRILNEANWEGTNWLGECLMYVRKRLYDKLVFDMQGKKYR